MKGKKIIAPAKAAQGKPFCRFDGCKNPNTKTTEKRSKR